MSLIAAVLSLTLAGADAGAALAVDATLLAALKDRDVMLEMRDGTTLRGRLLGGTPQQVILVDEQSGRVVTLDGSRIAGVRMSTAPAPQATPPAEPAAALTATPTKATSTGRKPVDPDEIPASGFDTEDLEDLVGHRIRVRTEDDETLTGRLLAVRSDGISLRSGDGKVTLTFVEMKSVTDLGRPEAAGRSSERGSSDARASREITAMDLLAASTLESQSLSLAIWGWGGIVTGALGCAAAGIITVMTMAIGLGVTPYALGIACGSALTIGAGIWGVVAAGDKKREADLIRSGRTLGSTAMRY